MAEHVVITENRQYGRIPLSTYGWECQRCGRISVGWTNRKEAQWCADRHVSQCKEGR